MGSTLCLINHELRDSLIVCAAASEAAARFGRIDRSSGEVTSRLDAICTLVTIDS